ncbi:MAG TPA: ABC transporter permease [Anaerolineae bacterium]|nr:ABC transporter permease [Anaerolineae bacterium]
MSLAAGVPEERGRPRESARPGQWARLRLRVRRLRFTWLATVGIAILVLIVLVAAFAPHVTPYDPSRAQVMDRLQPPMSVDRAGNLHLLGTDTLGRDILTRVVYGARVSLLVGLSSVLIGGLLGITLGLLGGYWGGLLDDVMMRVADVQLALPGMLLYIAVLAAFGGGLTNIIVILGITGWVSYARLVRGQVLALRKSEFVDAARSIGAGPARIMVRHLLPNVIGPVIVVASFSVARNIIAEASLSFLGVGVPASVPTWGSMLSEARDTLRQAWWPATFPGVALVLVVLAINSVGDWLRDYLDPRLKE